MTAHRLGEQQYKKIQLASRKWVLVMGLLGFIRSAVMLALEASVDTPIRSGCARPDIRRCWHVDEEPHSSAGLVMIGSAAVGRLVLEAE